MELNVTKAGALQKFFASFGLDAYPINAVPNDVTFPYLTYENEIASQGRSVNPTVNLWFYTESEAIPNEKADEISKAIGLGTSISCDDGAIYIYMTDGWHPLSDENDSAIKRRYTNMKITFNTF